MSRPDGIYPDVPHEEYHADPAVSSSMLKLLSDPSCPAKFRYAMDHPESREPTDAMDIGQALHTLMFGVGPEIVIVDANSWQTKAAQEARDQIRAEGNLPFLPKTVVRVRAMAKALDESRAAGVLLADGQPEVSFWWHEGAVACRGRVDWLPTLRDGRRLIVPDLKSALSAHPATFARKSAAALGYAQSADWYLRGLRANGYADDTAVFVFLAIEPKPPYVVQPIQLDSDAMKAGRVLNDEALATYVECTESGTWGPYVDGIALASLPAYYVNPVLERE